MKRKQHCITDKQDRLLKKESKESGLSQGDIIRRALDKYFEGDSDEK
jgi:hypothetical protein